MAEASNEMNPLAWIVVLILGLAEVALAAGTLT